jgi:RNA polymerase sigma-70 factor (ECF subfamily)
VGGGHRTDEGFLIGDLYGTHREPLLRFALSLARERSRAEDLVQDAFVRALSHLDLLARLNPYQRQAWLFRVVRNRFLDGERSTRRTRLLLERLAKEIARQAEPPPVDTSLFAILDAVPASHRDLLEKRYLLGMTSEEIGRALDVPPGTVRSRLRLAMEWIRSHRLPVDKEEA